MDVISVFMVFLGVIIGLGVIVTVFSDPLNVDELGGVQEVDIGANTDTNADESRTTDSSLWGYVVDGVFGGSN